MSIVGFKNAVVRVPLLKNETERGAAAGGAWHTKVLFALWRSLAHDWRRRANNRHDAGHLVLFVAPRKDRLACSELTISYSGRWKHTTRRIGSLVGELVILQDRLRRTSTAV